YPTLVGSDLAGVAPVVTAALAGAARPTRLPPPAGCFAPGAPPREGPGVLLRRRGGAARKPGGTPRGAGPARGARGVPPRAPRGGRPSRGAHGCSARIPAVVTPRATGW